MTRRELLVEMRRQWASHGCEDSSSEAAEVYTSALRLLEAEIAALAALAAPHAPKPASVPEHVQRIDTETAVTVLDAAIRSARSNLRQTRAVKAGQVVLTPEVADALAAALAAPPAPQPAEDDMDRLCVCGHSADEHGNNGAGHCGATKACRKSAENGGCYAFRPAAAPPAPQRGTAERLRHYLQALETEIQPPSGHHHAIMFNTYGNDTSSSPRLGLLICLGDGTRLKLFLDGNDLDVEPCQLVQNVAACIYAAEDDQ